MTTAETLQAIASDPRVLVPGDGFEEEAIADLVSGGAISSWSVEDQTWVTLTPYSAATFGLRIRQEKGSLALRWVSATKKRRARRPSKAELIEQPVNLDSLVDDKADNPSEIAVANERIEREIELRERRGVRRTDAELAGRLPYPEVLLTGCQAWSGRVPAVCPACKGSRLRAMTYCLRCDRWGLDWLLGSSSPKVVKKKAAKFRPKVSAASNGSNGK
jgi:hypothetical protein